MSYPTDNYDFEFNDSIYDSDSWDESWDSVWPDFEADFNDAEAARRRRARGAVAESRRQRGAGRPQPRPPARGGGVPARRSSSLGGGSRPVGAAASPLRRMDAANRMRDDQTAERIAAIEEKARKAQTALVASITTSATISTFADRGLMQEPIVRSALTLLPVFFIGPDTSGRGVLHNPMAQAAALVAGITAGGYFTGQRNESKWKLVLVADDPKAAKKLTAKLRDATGSDVKNQPTDVTFRCATDPVTIDSDGDITRNSSTVTSATFIVTAGGRVAVETFPV